MMIYRRLVLTLVFLPLVAWGQNLDPRLMPMRLSETWPTFNGDYSGKRFNALIQINRATVKNLRLAWTYRLNTGDGPAVRTGGEGPLPAAGTAVDPTARVVKASPLIVNGVLYFSTPRSCLGSGCT